MNERREQLKRTDPEYHDFLKYIETKKSELVATGATTDEYDFLDKIATEVEANILSIEEAKQNVEEFLDARSSGYH